MARSKLLYGPVMVQLVDRNGVNFLRIPNEMERQNGQKTTMLKKVCEECGLPEERATDIRFLLYFEKFEGKLQIRGVIQ